MENKESHYTSYSVATKWLNNSYVLCNNLPEIDPTVWENMIIQSDNDTDIVDDEYLDEIFQWYITDCTSNDVDWLKRTFDGLVFTYSELLNCYILCVTHYGTAWSCVPIEVKSDSWWKINGKEYGLQI